MAWIETSGRGYVFAAGSPEDYPAVPYDSSDDYRVALNAPFEKCCTRSL